jgi:hypothetical protein
MATVTLDADEREAVIDGLIENGCCFDEEDREVVNSLSDRTLARLSLKINAQSKTEGDEQGTGDPMHLVLHYSRDSGGATTTKIVAEGTDHSFNPRGLPPLKVGGSRHSTDALYGDAPPMQPQVDEEMMDEETRRRIGLIGGKEEEMPNQEGFVPNQDDFPRLVFRKGPDGRTISDII